MKFTILNLAQDVLTDLGLPVMTYEVPSAYLESANCEPNHLPLDGLLYALQVRAAEETVDWLKLAPAMDRLASLLQDRDRSDASVLETDAFCVTLGEVALDDEVITIQRHGQIVAAFQKGDGDRLVTQIYHPPCARTIQTILGLNIQPEENGVIPYYITNWGYALDSASGNGQYYAAEAGRTYLAHWPNGVGIKCEGETDEHWINAGKAAAQWPTEFSQAAINVYVSVQGTLDVLADPPSDVVDIPADYLLPKAPEPLIALNTYNLSQSDGRFAFLWALYNDYQEDGLLMAVNHIWDCLDTPRSLRCALMAQKVGKTGNGKRALVRFLRRFLDETLYEFEIPDLPDRKTYANFDAWNADCLVHFDRLETRMSAIIARYEAILDGRDPSDALPTPMGLVIQGPWRASVTS